MNTPQPPPPTDNRAHIRAEGQLFQSLLAHWIHEDQLYWTQVRHLLVLELAVLAALFSLNVSKLSAILMFVAAAVAWYLYSLADIIRQNRNSNVGTIAVVSKIVASTETQESVKSLLGTDDYNKWGTLRIARHDLLRYNLRTVRSYLLKEDFQFFWGYRSPYWAECFLDRWCTRTMRSKIGPMKRVARMLRGHRPLILNWFRAKGQLSSSVVEGFNTKAKLTTRKAYGFRTYHGLEVALYHALGALPEPKFTHRFS